MKKTLKKSWALFTCIALILTVIWLPPMRASAANGGSLRLSIEGSSVNIFSGTVPFMAGQTVEDVVKKICGNNSIDLTDTGGMITKIGNDEQTANWSKYWAFYINDAFSDKGVSQTPVHNGDDVILAYSGYQSSPYFSTSYPFVAVSPTCSKPGDTVKVTVTDSFSGAGIDGVTVKLDTQTQTTGSDGVATFAPLAASTYHIDVSKTLAAPVDDGHGSEAFETGFPVIIHRSIPITVANSAPADRVIGIAGSDRAVDLGSSVPVSSIDITGGSAVTLKTATGQIPAALTATFHNSYNLFTASFPAGTTVSGPSDWDGNISLEYPTGTISVPGGTSAMAVKVGSDTQNFTLSNYAKITLSGATGKKAGTIDASNYFHQIGTKLSSDATPDGFSEPDAYYDDGHDLIIYTKHLSTFVAYSPATSNNSDISSAISSAAAYLAGTGNDDYWAALALSRSGNTVPAGFLTDTAQTISDNGGTFTSAPGLAMTILGLRAAGANPLSFNGINLVEKLYNFDKIDASGANGPIFALLALDSGKYDVPSGAKNNDTNLIAKIKTYQKSDGGFSLSSGGTSDPDITAMAITALAPHRADAGVATVIDAALNYLSSKLTSNVGLIPNGSTDESSETASWAVIALSSVGVDPANDLKFVKANSSGKIISLLDNLMSFRLSNGSFEDKHGSGADTIATQQALMALSTYQRFLSGSPRFFDLTDTSGSITSVSLDNPHTGSTDFTPVIVTIPCMLALLIVTNLKRRRRANRS